MWSACSAGDCELRGLSASHKAGEAGGEPLGGGLGAVCPGR